MVVPPCCKHKEICWLNVTCMRNTCTNLLKKYFNYFFMCLCSVQCVVAPNIMWLFWEFLEVFSNSAFCLLNPIIAGNRRWTNYSAVNKEGQVILTTPQGEFDLLCRTVKMFFCPSFPYFPTSVPLRLLLSAILIIQMFDSQGDMLFFKNSWCQRDSSIFSMLVAEVCEQVI